MTFLQYFVIMSFANIISGHMKLKFKESENLYVNETRTVTLQLESNTPPQSRVTWFYMRLNGSEEYKLGTRKFMRDIEGKYEAKMQLEYIDKPPFLGEDFHVGARLNDSVVLLSNFTAILPAPWDIKFINTPVMGEDVTISCKVPVEMTDGIILKKVQNKTEREGNIVINNSVCTMTYFTQFVVSCEHFTNHVIVSVTIPASNVTLTMNNSFWRIGKSYGRATSKYKELILAVAVTRPTLGVLPSNLSQEGDVIQIECLIWHNSTPPVRYTWYLDGKETTEHTSSVNLTLQRSLYKKAIECGVSNLERPPLISSPYVLQFLHSPNDDLKIEGIQTYSSITETQDPQQLKCLVNGGYPRPSLEFSCEGRETDPAYGHNASTTWKSITVSLNRSMNGVNCLCSVTQKSSNFSTNESFALSILFPSSVHVDDIDTQEGENVTIKCKLLGNPDKFEIKWKHYVGNTTVRNDEDLQKFMSMKQSELFLESVIPEDSGVYECSASNGVKDLQDELWQNDSGKLVVTGRPVFIYNHKIFYGSPGEKLRISIPVLAFPKVKMKQIELLKADEKMHSPKSSDINIDLQDTTLSIQSYGRTVQKQGQIIMLEIPYFHVRHVGNYYITLTADNKKRTLFNFEIRANITQIPESLSANFLTDPFPWAMLSCFLFVVLLGFLFHKLIRTKRSSGVQRDIYLNDSLAPLQINLGSIAECSHVWRGNSSFRYSSVNESVDDVGYETMSFVPKPGVSSS